MTGEVDEDEGVPGWIPPDDVRVLGKLFWARRKAREKGPEAEGKYVSRSSLVLTHDTDYSPLPKTSGHPFPRCSHVSGVPEL